MQRAVTKREWLSLGTTGIDPRAGVSPAALGAFLCLLIASPLMRGGNRHVALVLLEAAAIAFIAMVLTSGTHRPERSRRQWVLAFVLLSPAWLALVYLLPIPPSFSGAGSVRAMYSELLANAGIPAMEWQPLSLAPDATLVSLLSGTLLIAAALAGSRMSAAQLRKVLIVFVAASFVQVVFGLLQASGGESSSLYFGGKVGRPFGTFANPNHFANYLGMALVAFILLAHEGLTRRRDWHEGPRKTSREGPLILWSSGGVFLLVGILMSGSRAGTVAALASTTAAFMLVMAFGSRSRRKSWRARIVLPAIAVVAGVVLVGADAMLARFDLEKLQGAIPFRAIQATTTLQGAAELWPWGAGWGTYYSVYPRFQPSNLVGIADYTHNDYLQMLFEAGIFGAVLAAACAYLLIKRAFELVRSARRHHKLSREEMTCAVCGIGLLGFLLHSIAEFNMHIPANAIIASLLAGVYLRPLEAHETRGAHPEPAPHD
ncbi:MAG TPA: O-antigen ligase family protein [Ramlibacter sp.]|uniref:O-antigen ligase family protein n=1 Tax=Ramlibacter sp. TaxID=1917967 RepID=UPI002ED0C70F